ncbi:hypothetical protein QUA43_24300 [Microcoleus sp. N9_B4]|uniref:hypothetical protein n=1 Tax=Microcoleus sp. N9_B4 TaxID=3055386 RepID=UPI002FD1DD53
MLSLATSHHTRQWHQKKIYLPKPPNSGIEKGCTKLLQKLNGKSLPDREGD